MATAKMDRMIPMGYMAKQVCAPPKFLERLSWLIDIYSVGSCVNDDFCDFVNHWKHNGCWFFDSPQIIRDLAKELSIDLSKMELFYYEVYEREFTGEQWREFRPWESPGVNVLLPDQKSIEGYDVVTFWPENSSQPGHSPLSCNSLTEKIETNSHCLLDSIDNARRQLEQGAFAQGEPGPWRIIAAYSVEWA